MTLLQYVLAVAAAAVATGIAYVIVRRDFFLPSLVRLLPAKLVFPLWIVVSSAVVATLFMFAWPPLPKFNLPLLPRRFPTLTAIAALVMAVMLIVLVWVGLELLWRYHRSKRETLELLGKMSTMLARRQYDEVIALTRHYRGSHVARMVAAGVIEFQREKEQAKAVSTVAQEIDRARAITVDELKSGLQTLATISTTAPFVGLFGTVIGVINAFRGMAITGSGGWDAVAAGIAEALFTTAVGLLLALPAVWLYSYFLRRLDHFTAEMSNVSSELQSSFKEQDGSSARVGA